VVVESSAETEGTQPTGFNLLSVKSGPSEQWQVEYLEACIWALYLMSVILRLRDCEFSYTFLMFLS
jgi:hypothetical protein